MLTPNNRPHFDGDSAHHTKQKNDIRRLTRIRAHTEFKKISPPSRVDSRGFLYFSLSLINPIMGNNLSFIGTHVSIILILYKERFSNMILNMTLVKLWGKIRSLA
ncbi:hypothetical protein KP509_20G036500 [Ceratopteris richardii]|uniref:Uncharacterized protein n=1 Tax=Ceratopteris richardii TaxID=49495 RepID=A0A8T2SHZ4_CERRI|nr:hypothetical protein KP509_20G036500 [Ceratopteris richardii]